MSDEFRRAVDEANAAIHESSHDNGRAPIRDDDDAVARLSALLSVEPRDLDAEPVTPMDPLPGFPFVTPRAVAHLSGPTGRGKSQIVQSCCLELALAGGRALYLGFELDEEEWRARAKQILLARGHDLTSERVRGAWRSVVFTEEREILTLAYAHPAAWARVCAQAGFGVLVLDPASIVGATLNLDFLQSNADWTRFRERVAAPVLQTTAVLTLDNVGHSDKQRAIGASAKGGNTDIDLVGRVTHHGDALTLNCTKARGVRMPFKRGDAWVAFAHYRTGPQPIDATQAAIEQIAGEDRKGPYELVMALAPVLVTEPISRRALAASIGEEADHRVDARWSSVRRAFDDLVAAGTLQEVESRTGSRLAPGTNQDETDDDEGGEW